LVIDFPLRFFIDEYLIIEVRVVGMIFLQYNIYAFLPCEERMGRIVADELIIW